MWRNSGSSYLSMLLPLIVLAGTSSAWAHKPFFSDGSALDADHALIIKDADISQVVYHEVDTRATRQLWLALDLSAKQTVFLQIGTPALASLRDYCPSFALVGPGLPEIDLPFAVPPGMGATTWSTNAAKDSQFFHEPFTGTDSWILRQERLKVSQAGRYYAVAFVGGDKPGKFWLAVGTQEKWGLADFLKMGDIRKKVKAFHEVADRGTTAATGKGETEMITSVDEQLLFEFKKSKDETAWTVINDNVMGGVSRGGLSLTKHGTGLFSGQLSLENNGGFSSIQSQAGAPDLSGFEGITLRCRGDGKRYKFALRTGTTVDGTMYQASFDTLKNEWVERFMAFRDFIPTYHGRVVENAAPLDPSRIRSFGLLIADGQAGPFELEIEWIKTRLCLKNQ